MQPHGLILERLAIIPTVYMTHTLAKTTNIIHFCAADGLKRVQAGEMPRLAGTRYREFGLQTLGKVIYYGAPGKMTKYLRGIPRNWGNITMIILNMIGILVEDVFRATVYGDDMLLPGKEGRLKLLKLIAGTIFASGISLLQYCYLILHFEATFKIKKNDCRKQAIDKFLLLHDTICRDRNITYMPSLEQWSIAQRALIRFYLESLQTKSCMLQEDTSSPFAPQ